MSSIFKNLKGKNKYVVEIVQNYKDWYVIFFNRLFKIHTEKIHLRNGIVAVGGVRSLIVDLIDEIFVKEVYNPDFMRINTNDTVMDIGANIGIFSLYAAKQGTKKIYSIEPLSQNISLIKNNFKINKLKVPDIDNVAVSDKNGISKLYLGDLDSHGLLFDRNFERKLSKYKEVKTITLNGIFKIHKIDKLDFLKIDCEGSEGEIIKSTQKDTWKKIQKIAIEYHDKVSTLSHKKIVESLKGYGYKTKIKPTGKFFGYIYAWRV